MFRALLDFGERNGWHIKYAKFNRWVHQSLLGHSFNVASLSLQILDFFVEKNLIKPSDQLRIQLLLTGFLHDAGKDRNSWQQAVHDFLDGRGVEPPDYGHQNPIEIQPVVESLKQFLVEKFPDLSLPIDFWDGIIWSIVNLGSREDAGGISHSFQRAPSRDALLFKEIVHLADRMMSCVNVEDAASVCLDGFFLPKISLTYSKVSSIRGILTHFLHAALEDQFIKADYKPIMWFPNGTVYIGLADTKTPYMDPQKLVQAIVEKILKVLNESSAKDLAKAAYGNLVARVIAAPEFLFLNKDVIHEFWQYVSNQRFAKPNIANIESLAGAKITLYNQFLDHFKDEETAKTYFTRFVADFNLLTILYAALKELVEKASIKSIESESTSRVREILSKKLEIPLSEFSKWPEIANSTKATLRFSIAQTLWLSPYYNNLAQWRDKFFEALEMATVELANLWKSLPNRYADIARQLVSDITNPLDPDAIMNTVKDMNKAIFEGKTGKGTTICQRCGGVADYEAQAELFGKSEIYHDHLVAGSRVGGGNKLRVCELCEFEEKLRSAFIRRGQEPLGTFYVIPHLALSRDMHRIWQEKANDLVYNTGKFPSLLRVNRWAEKVIENKLSTGKPLFYYSSANELTRAIERVVDEDGIKDLSLIIDPPLHVEDTKTLSTCLKEGKCKLLPNFANKVNEIINQVKPIYITPNYILLLTSSSVKEGDEPDTATEVRWLFFRCLLAYIFKAAVISGKDLREEAIVGYTLFPSNIALRSLGQKLNVKNGWIPISRLEESMKRLAALILVARELTNLQAGYGNATLLSVLNEEPGRIVARAMDKNQVLPKRLIRLLDTWYYRE